MSNSTLKSLLAQYDKKRNDKILEAEKRKKDL